MDAAKRVVTSTPLYVLWDDSGELEFKRKRWIGREELTTLLRSGAVQFVVADCGTKLLWVPLSECFRFWKTEVKEHLAEPTAQSRPELFRGLYFFFASEWDSNRSIPIIVLERHH